MIFYNATKRCIMLLQNKAEFVTMTRKTLLQSIQQQAVSWAYLALASIQGQCRAV